MRIAIDAMGGDHAPAAPVEGALRALATYADIEIVLVGDPAGIEAARAGIAVEGADPARLHVHDAPEVAGSGTDPVKAVRSSPRNSARACADLLRTGEVAGVLSMGNTGAAVAAATLYCRRLKGVRRTGIAVPFPRPGGASILVDSGANPDARPEELYQYAVMGAQYARAALGVAAPRIGILSIGEESYKGNRLVQETWEVFRANPPEHFVGNVEPRELFADRADVVVCDGFTGNITLKAAEGMAEFVLGSLKPLLAQHAPEAAGQIMKALAARVDYSAYGGAPLLGVDGGYVIGHGRSSPAAFVSGVRVLRAYVLERVGEHIVARLAATPGAAG